MCRYVVALSIQDGDLLPYSWGYIYIHIHIYIYMYTYIYIQWDILVGPLLVRTPPKNLVRCLSDAPIPGIIHAEPHAEPRWLVVGLPL